VTVELAGSAGPHVFVESLENMLLSEDDNGHLSKSLRMRSGDPMTASDGRGSWRSAAFQENGVLEPIGEIVHIPLSDRTTTIAFSLVKGNKPELVIQKLTEVGVDNIVVLAASRSIVKWDEAKESKAFDRWRRIIREAAMQSHRVRLPSIDGVIAAGSWLARTEVTIADFGGSPIAEHHTSIAIGPEGGWTDSEAAGAGQRIGLGPTVLRAETAAIVAGTLLTAATTQAQSDVR
jgi:16S rRNA (uracil1498-N3)-methyltransferase